MCIRDRPKIFVSDIPIGVVIDLGNIEYSICESAFATLQISTTHINDIKTPVSIPTNISFIYFLNRWNCLYRGCLLYTSSVKANLIKRGLL